MKSNSLFDKVYELWLKTRLWHIPVWIVLHVVVVLLFLLHPQFSISTDLYTVLPDSNPNQVVSKAEEKMSANAGAGFLILVGNKDFSQARAAAESFYTELHAHSGIETLNFHIEPTMLADFQEYLYRYRYRLLSNETESLLNQKDTDALARDAFQVISNPIAVGALTNIDTDPYLLANRSLRSFLASGVLNNMAMTVRQDVLAGEHEGVWYVLVSGTIKGKGSANTDGNPVPAIRSAAAQTQALISSTEFIFSGIPFHTYDSSINAQREIELISTISMIVVILILVVVFFSIRPLAITLIAMFVGIGIGTLATFVCFKEVHLFTIVFGTSLIGISIDYSLHYFAEWMNPGQLHDGPSIIKRIVPGITMGLLTTLVSYAAFCLAPFPLLRQMAVFSSIGLTSTWLSVIFLYPKLKPPKRIYSHIPLRFASSVLNIYERFIRIPLFVRISLSIVIVVVAGFGLSRVHINNDLKAMYKMSPEMALEESKSAAILQHGSTGAYLMVRGKTPEEVLRSEENLCSRLADLQQKGALGAWSATSTLMPSHQQQDHAYALMGSIIMPTMATHMESLGFGPQEVAAVQKDYQEKSTDYINLDYYFSLPIAALTRNLWIGQVDGEWFSAVLLFNVHDKKVLNELAAQYSNVYFINKAEDIAHVLQDLSFIAIILLIAAYFLIFLGLWYLYGIREALKISAIPVAASLLTSAILGFTTLPFNLFAIIGLILVPGIGIDYAIFYKEGAAHRSVTMLAITLSMLSTILSFGSLAFSSLAGVFGVTVALGVTISFILAPFTLERKTPQTGEQASQYPH